MATIKHKMKLCRGRKCKLFVENIFDCEWKATGEITTEKDSFHNVKVQMPWYTIEYNEETKKFGCAEIGADQYMFLYD